MKYIVDNKHREFFSSNGWVEFEQLLAAQKLQELQNAVKGTLAKRLGIDQGRLSKYSGDELYLKGRDLWRDSDVIKSVVCQRHLAEIAANLVEVTPVRLGYDQAFVAGAQRSSSDTHRFDGVATLKDSSCIQGLLCGLLIALTDAPSGEAAQEPVKAASTPAQAGHGVFLTPGIKIAPIPTQAGHGVFLSPSIPVDFSRLLSGSYLLIAYSKAVSVVIYSEKDPHTNFLRALDYAFGDKLIDQHHPILYR